MTFRTTIGRFTSPLFVPLRRFVVWMDDKVGTCDHKLTLQTRCEIDIVQEVPQISLLEKKLSKDKANLEGLGEKPVDRMNCWNCGTQMIWGGDHSFDDVGLDGDGIVSNFSCPTCSAHADFYVSI